MNLLGQETSPYLRQHKDNPVHWMPWGDDAFARARTENKPILLSVGYAACHWCHVMAHESFEDAGTADLMNSLFINIKVDREERPDVDALYQNAQALMGGQGGWPLTVFLTPEGKAFWGGTYFPPHPRHGLPSFREVLRGVADGFMREPDKIIHNVNSLNTALEKLHTGDTGRMVLPEQSAQIGEALLRFTDPAHGGFGSADSPKFPNLPALNLLWDSYIRTGSDKLKASVLQALTAMCQGGLYDHVGGGFARYTVDGEWLVPHFEKMLYDNAQFISLLTEVYRETQNPLFAAHIRSTIDWLLREMRVTVDGEDAFASSLDADSLDDAGHLEEGAFYVWRGQDIDFLLGDDAPYFREVFDITAFGNWHEKQGWNIPNRLAHPEWRGEGEEHKISALCRKLRFTRDQRATPARDHKILADWNGMLVAALAQAGFVFDMPAWTAQAESIFRFVTRQMMQPDGQLYHVWCDGRAAHTGFVEDYAQMMSAALALHDVTENTAYLDAAVRWADILCRDYADETGGGFFMTAASAQDLPIRPKTGDDTALPAGNAVLVGALQRLYTLTGNALWADKAMATAQAFSGIATRHIFPRATLIRHSLSIASPLSVVITGTPAARADLMAVLRGISVPALVVQQTSGTETLSPSHPAFGKKPTADAAAAFICTGRQCQAPVHNPTTFREILLSARAGAHRPPANDG